VLSTLARPRGAKRAFWWMFIRAPGRAVDRSRNHGFTPLPRVNNLHGFDSRGPLQSTHVMGDLDETKPFDPTEHIQQGVRASCQAMRPVAGMLSVGNRRALNAGARFTPRRSILRRRRDGFGGHDQEHRTAIDWICR
jgi:hypothetical protein